MSNYSDKLKNPQWQKKRLEILNRDEFTCQYCNSTDKELQVHHKMYKANCNPWEYDDKLLITLCLDCHKEAEEVRKAISAGLVESFYLAGIEANDLLQLQESLLNATLNYGSTDIINTIIRFLHVEHIQEYMIRDYHFVEKQVDVAYFNRTNTEDVIIEEGEFQSFDDIYRYKHTKGRYSGYSNNGIYHFAPKLF